MVFSRATHAADDLAAGVQREGEAVSAAEGAEIDHPASRRPREGMKTKVAGGITRADDLATVVHCEGSGGAASEGAEIDHPTRRCPGEGMMRGIARGNRADDLTAGGHRGGLAS